MIRWADVVIHCLQQLFYGRPVIQITAAAYIQPPMRLSVDVFVLLRVLMPTFSPPCGCEGAAPGRVGAGDDTEL